MQLVWLAARAGASKPAACSACLRKGGGGDASVAALPRSDPAVEMRDEMRDAMRALGTLAGTAVATYVRATVRPSSG